MIFSVCRAALKRKCKKYSHLNLHDLNVLFLFFTERWVTSSVFSKELAACNKNSTNARARKNKHTARMLAKINTLLACSQMLVKAIRYPCY